MSKLTALALSIAVLGGVWAFLALGPLAGSALVWAGFIAWGCYFHTGGDGAALQKTIVGMIYGAVVAGVALALVVANPIGLAASIVAPVYVAVTVFFLVIVAGVNLLSVVPANVYGYAATAGYALSTNTANLTTTPDLTNPVLLVALSVVIGTLFGAASGKLAGMLGK
jgi:ABC-type phosphate transport system permease subunit